MERDHGALSERALCAKSTCVGHPRRKDAPDCYGVASLARSWHGWTSYPLGPQHAVMSGAAALLRFKLGSAVVTLAVAALGVALPWIFHRMLSERTAAWPKRRLGSAPARLLCLLRARLAALGASTLPGERYRAH